MPEEFSIKAENKEEMISQAESDGYAPEAKPKNQLAITEDDRTKFFDCIVADTSYTEEISVFDGKLILGFRTLNIKETDIVRSKMKEVEYIYTNNHDIDFCKYTIAFSFCGMANPNPDPEKSMTIKYDSGDLVTRIARVDKFTAPKYMLIADSFIAFNDKVSRLGKEAAISGNFS